MQSIVSAVTGKFEAGVLARECLASLRSRYGADEDRVAGFAAWWASQIEQRAAGRLSKLTLEVARGMDWSVCRALAAGIRSPEASAAVVPQMLMLLATGAKDVVALASVEELSLA